MTAYVRASIVLSVSLLLVPCATGCGSERGPGDALPRSAADAGGDAPRDAGPGGSSESAKLCLQAELSRTRATLGEPVYLLVSLVNCGSEPRTVRDLLDPSFGLLVVEVRRPARSTVKYRSPVQRDGRGARRVELAPESALTVDVPIFADREGWRLDSPGRYLVSARYPAGSDWIHAEDAELRVEAPADDAGVQAARRMTRPDAARYLLFGDPRGDAAGARVMREIRARYDGSVFATHALLALAGHGDVDDPRDVDAAARAIEATPDPVAAARCAAGLSRSLLEDGRVSESKQIVEAFRARARTVLLPSRLEQALVAAGGE